MRKTVNKKDTKNTFKQFIRKTCFATGVTIFCCLLLFCIHAFNSGLIQHKIELLKTYWWQFFTDMGFSLQQEDGILMKGRDKTDAEEIKKIVNSIASSVNYSILRLNVNEIQDKLKKLPWIKNVQVTRKLPNFLFIEIVEKKSIALFKEQNNYYPIDETGNIINAKEDGNFEEAIIIVGKGSVKKTPELITALNKKTALKERVMGAKYISERRWRLYIDDLENGVVIDLSEAPLEENLTRLEELQQKYKIFDKQAKRVDLRLKDRAIIEPLTPNSILKPFSENKEKKP